MTSFASVHTTKVICIAAMADPSEGSTSTAPRGRGRGKRGGLGKYLRARGRRGGGRPAEFRERLVLEGEESGEIDPEEAEEITRKYAKRTIVSSVHRSEPDPEPILNSDGPCSACYIFADRSRLAL